VKVRHPSKSSEDTISLFIYIQLSGSKACFITAFEDYRQEFKESFPELDERKCFFRKPKAIEDLVKHVATIFG
jgi:hypothetical protein